MLFLNWRYSMQLEQYIEMKGPMEGGMYSSFLADVFYICFLWISLTGRTCVGYYNAYNY
jgi:hypothetical protein